MPSYLDFDTTNNFRKSILARTLTVPNGPDKFSADNYTVKNTRDMANIDPGDVEDVRPEELTRTSTSNVFKPTEFSVKENLQTIPRRANLSLYPYFETGQYHSFVSIMSGGDYDNESELMKFAAWNIQNNTQGPFYGRLQTNLYRTTAGKVRVLDALDGNLATATNLLTGREPLIEGNNKITVAKTLPGKGIDFLQTVTGVEFPWSEIPGNYLTDPRNPIIARPETAKESNKIGQDIAGSIGSLFGISRRPTPTRKPSDLMIEYLGHRNKMTLYNNLSYLKYGPNYTTTARSQNTSKLFNVIDNVSQGVKDALGLEAPSLSAYIGDDRGITPTLAMYDFNDRPVKGTYYLSLLFDEVQTKLFLRTKNIAEGGGIGGKLTWISPNSKNKLGINNDEYSSEESQFTETLSTGYDFREDSILGLTQDILNTMPTEGGAARSHIANVIDQTSRIFRDDDQMLSRGSAIKYVDKFTGTETGAEYCRVWTKDRSYMNLSDTMKRTGNVRKFGSSVLDSPWNLNIYPNSNGNGGFDSSSTNIVKGNGGFYAKKYMFSIENLAWKSSNTPGFTYNDLPYCERGPNGGRVMWFPPYDLKVQEQNNANWESNTFLGRPEPVYTYQNAQRNGTVSFKVVVDHPSILNLMVKDLFKGMSDDESDNYINAFFAGCKDLDFYALIRRFAMLSQDDVKKIQAYLNGNKDPETITTYKDVIRPIPFNPTPDNGSQSQTISSALYFRNDYPDPNTRNIKTSSEYSALKDDYVSFRSQYLQDFETGFATITGGTGWSETQKVNFRALTLEENLRTTRPTADEFTNLKAKCIETLNEGFDTLDSSFTTLSSNLSTLKTALEQKTVGDISIRLQSRTSSVADDYYNLYLAYRRSYSIVKEIISQIAATTTTASDALTKFETSWKTPAEGTTDDVVKPTPIKLSTLGYEGDGELNIEYIENVGEQEVGATQSGTKNVDCTDKFQIVGSSELKRTSPITFWCRETSVDIKYDIQAKDEVPEQVAPTDRIEITTTTEPLQTPPIDEMKRIIMKTLSECYYFKKLEEDSPVQFSSLKEKLRYFHPSFHSTTPEGLNTRLTFLQQCLRPGETIPIKGVSDKSDLNARNTTFGPPPICVMRIGDFYHSKVAIKDVNIEFEENLWDINPEGIGVQPMIANVTMQLYFIGGHGLAKPVERLQNALSSNFYANTEMYDDKSISTETTIDGKDTEKFTKEFLEDLVKEVDNRSNTTSQATPPTEKSFKSGEYIGELDGSTIDYRDLVTKTFTDAVFYFGKFRNAYNQLLVKYDTKLLSMFISPTYRTIKDYTVQTNTTEQTLELLGNYPKSSELSVLVGSFKTLMLNQIDADNISTIFGFDKDLTPAVIRKSEDIIKPYIKKTVGGLIDEMSINTQMLSVEKTRNELIKDLDKLNFIIQYGHDSKIVNLQKNEYVYTELSGYTADELYPQYSKVVSFISENHNEFFEDLDSSYSFARTLASMTTSDLSYFLSVLLKGKTNDILAQYKKDQTVFTERILKDMRKRLTSFILSDPDEKTFDFVKTYPKQDNLNPISFGISDEITLTDTNEIESLKSVRTESSNKTTSVLNYYR